MKRLTCLFAAAIACLCTITTSFASEPVPETIPLRELKESNLVFKGGESLTFTVHYKWGVLNADVAKATVKIDEGKLDGKDVYHASLYAWTQSIYASVIDVKERLDSWFTRDGLVPVKFKRDSKEGNYTCTNDYTYVWNSTKPHIEAALNNSRRGSFNVEIPLNKSTYDLTLLYNILRNIDTSKLVEGGRYPMTFAVDDDVYNLHFVYFGKENKKVPGLGTVASLKFGFQVVSGDVFAEGADLFVWFSDDANMIPVMFVAPLKVGQVQGRLQMFTGLKNDFKSLKKR